MVARILVTTAQEETWPPPSEPIVFLGEWCKLFRRKHHWERWNYTTLPYHWDDRQKLQADYFQLQTLYENTLQSLCKVLNEKHGVNHTDRYWRIVLGQWLGYFIEIVFDRWFMLKTALETTSIKSVQLLYRAPGEGVPQNMAEFCALFVEDDWNELICAQLLQRMVPNLVNEYVEKQARGPRDQEPARRKALEDKLKRRAARLLARCSTWVTRSQDYFFIASYLAPQQEFAMQLKLGQMPKVWRSPPMPQFTFRAATRQWQIEPQLSALTPLFQEFADFLTWLVPAHLPLAYWEGYAQLREFVNDLNWPAQPKAIFTSNAYSSDDVFKVWAAEKVGAGAPLIIGQHGGNYGMARWSYTEEHQLAIADRFVTWGWTNPAQPNIAPVGNLKGFGRHGIRSNPTGKALLVEMTMPRYSYHLYSAPVATNQMEQYLADQYAFVAALPENLRQEVLVRLYASDYGFSQAARWQEKFPGLALDAGIRPMKKLLKQTKLYISTYNATTYLESMALNFPTLMFWNPQHWELREGVQPYFDLLKEVGIFHETPAGAAAQMIKIWDDVDKWWYHPETQNARKVFCSRFAHIPDKPSDKLAELVKQTAKKTNSI